MRSKLLILFILLTTILKLTAQDVESDNDIITLSNVDQLELIGEFGIEGITELYWLDEVSLFIETYAENWLLDLNSMELSLFETEVPMSEDQDFYATVDMKSEDDIVLSEMITVFSSSSNELVIEIHVILYNEICGFACPVFVTFNPLQNQLVYVAQVADVESAFVDLETGQKYVLPEQGYFSPSYSPDGEMFAVFVGNAGYIPGNLYVFEAQTGTLIREIPLYGSGFAFDTSGDIIAIGRYDDTAPNPDESIGILHFYDVSELPFEGDIEPITTLSLERPPGTIAFSTDNRFMALGTDNENQQLSVWAVPITEE